MYACPLPYKMLLFNLLKEHFTRETYLSLTVSELIKIHFAGVYFSRTAKRPERSTKELFQFNSSSTGIRVSTDMSHRVQQYTTVANMSQVYSSNQC